MESRSGRLLSEEGVRSGGNGYGGQRVSFGAPREAFRKIITNLASFGIDSDT